MTDLGGACLSTERQSRDADALRGIVLGGTVHQLLDLRGSVRGEHADVLVFVDGDVQLVDQIAVVIDDVGRCGSAAVRDGGGDHRHEHRIRQILLLTDARPGKAVVAHAGRIIMALGDGDLAHHIAVVVKAQFFGGGFHFFFTDLHRDLRESAVAGVGERLGKALGAVGGLAGDWIAVHIDRAVTGEALVVNIGDVLDRRSGGDDLERRAGGEGRGHDVIEIHAVVLALVILGDGRRIGGVIARRTHVTEHLACFIIVDHTRALVTAERRICRAAGIRADRQADIAVGAKGFGQACTYDEVVARQIGAVTALDTGRDVQAFITDYMQQRLACGAVVGIIALAVLAVRQHGFVAVSDLAGVAQIGRGRHMTVKRLLHPFVMIDDGDHAEVDRARQKGEGHEPQDQRAGHDSFHLSTPRSLSTLLGMRRLAA